MPRYAVLVANSVSYLSDIQKSITKPMLRRTVAQISEMLRRLPKNYSFQIYTALDEREKRVRDLVERIARRAKSANSLLLFYYFGHGDLTEDSELQFVHPGKKRGEREFLRFTAVQDIFRNTVGISRTLTILDCCFSAAAGRKFDAGLRGENCLLASTTPIAAARIHYQKDEPPIGAFTRSMLNGLAIHDACVSNTNNEITAESLFRYASAETRTTTGGLQEPYYFGHLSEPISEYVPIPEIEPGFTLRVNPKTGYMKIFAICRTLQAQASFRSTRELYRQILKRYRKSFLVAYVWENGVHRYRPAKYTMLTHYIAFLRAIEIMDESSLSLSPRGRDLMGNWRTNQNRKFLIILDKYLADRGLSRPMIDETIRKILARRRMPTRTEVFTDLSLIGRRLPAAHLGLLLDLLGYIGAVRASSERVYFHW